MNHKIGTIIIIFNAVYYLAFFINKFIYIMFNRKGPQFWVLYKGDQSQ